MRNTTVVRLRLVVLPVILELTLFVGALVLSSCTHDVSLTGPTPDNKPAFEFLDYDLKQDSQGDKVELAPEGIYSIDRGTIFIFGALERTADGAKRTFILRSSDSGRTWEEVSTPETSRVIYHVAFVEGGYGWALSIVHTNDVGGPEVYRTFDGGQSWTQPVPIKVSGASFYPLGMQFVDKETGKINFMDVMFTPLDRFGTVSTKDGGATWQETFSLPVPYDKDYRNASYILGKLEAEYSGPPGGFYGSHWRSTGSDATYDATGRDGSEWHLYYHKTSEEYILIRRSSSKSDWEVAVSVPRQFSYEDGHISQP